MSRQIVIQVDRTIIGSRPNGDPVLLYETVKFFNGIDTEKRYYALFDGRLVPTTKETFESLKFTKI